MIGVKPKQDRCRRLALRIGGVDIAVRSDLPEVIDDLARLYRGFARDAAPGDDAIHVEVKRAGGRVAARRRYVVLGDGEPFGEEVHRHEVLPYLEWAVNWRVIARCTSSLLAHAASMARDGRGVVFAGPSGAGKSTLVAGLLARGWQYLGDEFAMIDARTLKLLPFPKAVCVKAGAFDLIRRLNLPLCGDRRYVKALKGTVGYISPSDLPAGAAVRPQPVRHLVFLRYTGHPEPRIRPLSAAKAAFMLTAQVLNRAALGTGAASTAIRIARGARCTILETGDIGGACNLVESLVSPPSG
jgi:HprK-related kinase A